MRLGWRFGLAGAVALPALLALAPPAGAVEYRLQAVSVHETTFVSYLRPGELKDGASGAGLDRLDASLDRGEVPHGAVLFDRRVQAVRESIARAYGGVPVVPRIKPGGEGAVAWDEVTWEGKPGERSVWLISPILRSIQELYRAALRSKGPLRYFQPYSVPMDGTRAAAVTFPLNFLWALEERGTAWDKYLSRGLDLETGIGVVVGVNFNAMFPDQAYLIVSHAVEPTTYKAVLAWRQRNLDREAPGTGNPILR